MSGHTALLTEVERRLHAMVHTGLVLPSLRAGDDEREIMLGSAARMYEAGYDLNWVAVNGPGWFAEIPQYQFQRQRCWMDVPPVSRSVGLEQ